MHCVRIPCLLIASLRQQKWQNKSANTVKQLNTISKHSTIVGMTGKISKWQLEKKAPKVLSSILLQNASVSDTEAQMSMGAKLNCYSLTFPINDSKKKLLK